MRSSSKKDYKIISNGKLFQVLWRYKSPKWFQTKGWQELKQPGIYNYKQFISTTKHDADVAVDDAIRADDPPEWVEVPDDRVAGIVVSFRKDAK